MQRRISLGLGAGALAVTLAACGGGSSATSSHSSMPMASMPTAVDHNAQDVMFAQMMIPHHAQAIGMAKLASSRAQSADVKALATKIEAAQGPEITTMSGWLESWGQTVPNTAGSMDMGSSGAMSMSTGMMTPTDMTELEGLSGSAFDRTFLTMMTQHHRGAIEMAETEQSHGKFDSARQLATGIIGAQTTEIAEMKHLLNTL